MKIILAGTGSIGKQHIKALQNIEGVELDALVSTDPDELDQVSKEFGVEKTFLTLEEALNGSEAEAVILATPTPLHAKQTLQVLEAKRHVLVEIPMSDSLEEAKQLVAKQEDIGLVAMVAHTRRFNPPHQWLHEKFKNGELHLKHLAVETFFHRRENVSAEGKPRDWADSLLWHHACHSVDLFQYQTGENIKSKFIQAGPVSEKVGEPLDMSIGLKSNSGTLATIALSFNNEGPFGSWFRYICEEGTFKVRYDDITDGHDNPVKYDWSRAKNGVELQDREFLAAIKEEREPNASVKQCLETMRHLAEMAETIAL